MIHLVAPRFSSARWLFSLKFRDLRSLSARADRRTKN
jgi:hypothetical protein